MQVPSPPSFHVIFGADTQRRLRQLYSNESIKIDRLNGLTSVERSIWPVYITKVGLFYRMSSHWPRQKKTNQQQLDAVCVYYKQEMIIINVQCIHITSVCVCVSAVAADHCHSSSALERERDGRVIVCALSCCRVMMTTISLYVCVCVCMDVQNRQLSEIGWVVVS